MTDHLDQAGTPARRTRVVIQSRLNSSRLPGKAMLTVAGMPLIELVARRAARSGHEVVVATSIERYDRRIADHLRSVGVTVVRGDLDDVLGRFVEATADLGPDDRVVRLTGDNPVADADLVDELVAALEVSSHAYGRVDIDRVPEGFGAEVFSVGDLRRADAAATAAYDREHVTPWLRRTLGELLFVPADVPHDAQAYRCTVDTLADYVRVAELFDGVPDPVAVPMRTLLTRLGASVAAEGPMVPRSGPPVVSAVILGPGTFATGPRRDRPVPHVAVRELLGRAVDHGISHVLLDGGLSAAVFAACAEPLFTRRLGVILDLSGATGGPPLTPSAWVADVERSFAILGRRSVDVLVVGGAGLASTDGPAAWASAQAFRAEGAARLVGVRVRTGEELAAAAAQEGLGAVLVAAELRAHPAATESLRALADAGVLVLGGEPVGPSGAAAALTLGPAHAVVVDAPDAAGVAEAIDQALAVVAPRAS